jgi:putative transposase
MSLNQAYTTADLASLLGRAVSSITRRANNEGWVAQKRRGRGGGKEYSFSNLPADVQSRILAHEEPGQAELAIASTPAVIPDWAHEIGLARFQVVAEFRKYLSSQAKRMKKGEATDAFLLAYNAGQLLEGAFDKLSKISKSTLYGWDKRLRDNDENYQALCDRRGKWTTGGKKGKGQIGPEAERIFLGCYLDPKKPSISLCIRATEGVLIKRGLKVPSPKSFRRFIKRFTADHNDLVTLKREGEKALKDKVGPYIRRDADLLKVGDVIFSDGHVLNFQAINPATNRPSRMTLICWFDWRSRMPVGWEIMPSENTVAISSALKMAITNLGQYPRVAYIDNGKAFRAKYFSSENSDIEALDGLYARLGIAVQYSRPYEARTKIVERFFGTFNEQCARLLPSYTGRSIDDKPAHMMRNEKYHQARHKEYIPTIQEVGEIFRLFVNWYGQQEHRGLGGQKPWEVFEAGRGQGVPADELDHHFLWRKLINPSRCSFTLPGTGIEYESDALYGLKKKVLATWSWADLSEVNLFDQEGRSLGKAYPTKAINPLAKHFGDSLDMLAVQEANKRQRTLKKATLGLAKELDGDMPPSALDKLPWMGTGEKTPLRVVPKPKTTTPEPEIDEAEIARLEAVKAKVQSLPSDIPNRPSFFASEYERYDWCFEQAVKKGLQLPAEDQAFMTTYEESEEYQIATGARFDQLRPIYQQQTIVR